MKYDILIATPLKLVSLIRAEAIDLSRVEMIIMDEADKLLELEKTFTNKNDDDDDEDEENEEPAQRDRSSFLNQVDEILAQCPKNDTVIRGLFSATIGAFVRELATAFLRNPVEVSIGMENTGASTIHQRLIFVGREDGKLLAIRNLIQEGLKPPVLLFVQSIDRAKELFRELVFDGINVDVIHASRSAHQREEIMKRFRRGDIWVLICTDLMARGIDFKGVQMVINYDLPLSPVNYIHRIGRTGQLKLLKIMFSFFIFLKSRFVFLFLFRSSRSKGRSGHFLHRG
jgi:ATP-dependent RNA helicase DDX52/ROK1